MMMQPFFMALFTWSFLVTLSGTVLIGHMAEIKVQNLRKAFADFVARASSRDIAFVFQSPRLAPWLTALDNILLGVELRFGRAEAKRRRARAESLLAMVGLAGAAKKYPAMLSGGERQR
eukprot:gene33534-38994_t